MMDNNLPDGFRMTEIGLVPEEWEVHRLASLDMEISDGNYASKYPRQSDFIDRGVPFIRANNFSDYRIIWEDMRFISEQKHSELQKGHLKKNDILITTRGQLGNVALVTDEFVDGNINAQIVRINTRDTVEPIFMLYYLSSFRSQREINSLRTGTTLPQLPIGKLNQVPIIIPPLPEQKNIATVLSTIQEAKEKTQAVIEATRELKKSLMKHLFTYGPVSPEDADKVPLKETEIGMVPEEWELVKLEDICISFFGGGTPSTRVPEYWDGDIHWTTSAYINGLYLNEGVKNITLQGLENSSSNLVPSGNLLIGTRVGVGKVAINLVDIAISQDLTGVIVDKDKVHLEFLALALMTDQSQGIFRLGSRGTTIKGIPRDDLVKIPIPLPSLTIQHQIADILSAVDHKIEAEENKKQALEELFKTLLNNLMTGRIRVNHLDISWR